MKSLWDKGQRPGVARGQGRGQAGRGRGFLRSAARRSLGITTLSQTVAGN